MKTELKAKFLHHLNQKRQDKGFTLIELLVVIIIIGILSAIALPSFLNQANKAKQSEAKQYVGSMNRAQQAKYAEDNGFVSGVDALGLGIKTQTTNYTYTVTGVTSDTKATNLATPVNKKSLQLYAGGVAIGSATGTGAATQDKTTSAVLCGYDGEATSATPDPNAAIGARCATGGTEVSK
ncbi:MAG: type IV pilin-like G/H family protein [Microcoleus sp. PH2017_25_DOB_D_A]|uniref:type IV pilin-like G/H family protein n=1 Tax=unclassified Microcoleus TaxID=2642155 RepID=UPI001DFF2FDD|nr:MULTISPECIES: type IV pilin-like G/H family protein [unclassified Microcoleus]MCC3534167.1 type IV pilin-like G/H family protein [Microcoleus sp. PH2017_25_DOB_D_A]MCC3546498.1 type IV pilin-like G/H family protein [Microcoleus sp. PH2017_24_DOB_U_A]TAE41815.1 MAG: prepilin-type N-terminal cleavage/methylation domain-containing protein [Oscillatoriales cyanobacterium]